MKKLFTKITALIIGVAGLTALSLGAAGCGAKSQVNDAPANVDIVKSAAPTDGSLPTAHTGLENLSYVAGVLDSCKQYHSFGLTVTNASITTQYTSSYKDYKDGVLVASDITYSSMVKSGTQTCVITNAEGKKEAYQRYSATPDKNTTHLNAQWEEGDPVFYDERAYLYTYGLFPTELSNYIINSETLLESGEVKVNPDGTYSQSFVFDPVASTYYYQYGMKTRGGLGGYPEFHEITFSVTFDAGWRVLSTAAHEVSTINKGVTVSSVSDTQTTYEYDGVEEEHISAFDKYYTPHIEDETVVVPDTDSDELSLDVTTVLSNGFSKVLEGGQTFEVHADLGVNSYAGLVFAGLDLADPLGTLKLDLSLGTSLEKQGLFVSYENGKASAYYGDDFALDVNLSAVKLVLEQFAEWGGRFATATQIADGEEGDPLSDLMNSFVLETFENSATLSLVTDNLLDLGFGVNLKLFFGVGNKTVVFRGASVSGLSFGGEGIDLKLTLNTTERKVPTRESIGANADLAEYMADVYSLLSSDLIRVDLALDGDGKEVSLSALRGIDVSASAFVDIEGITVGADVALSVPAGKDAFSAKLCAFYDYEATTYGSLIVKVYEICGKEADLSVKCTVDELLSAVKNLLTLAKLDAAVLGANDISESAVKIINGVLQTDFSAYLTELKADKAEIKLGINLDTILSSIGVDAGVKLGSCALSFRSSYGGGSALKVNLPAVGFSLKVSGASDSDCTLVKPANPYDLKDLLNLAANANVKDIANLFKSGYFVASLGFDGAAIKSPDLSGLSVSADIAVCADGSAAGAKLHGEYKGISLDLSAAYANADSGYEIVVALDKINGISVGAAVGCRIDETVTAVKTLLKDVGAVVTNPLPDISGDILGNILKADFTKILCGVTVKESGFAVDIDADELLSAFGMQDTGVTLGIAELGYADGNGANGGTLSLGLPSFGISLTLAGAASADGFATVADMAAKYDVLDIAALVKLADGTVNTVNKIIAGKSLRFDIEQDKTYMALDGLTVGLSGCGEVDWGAKKIALDLKMYITEGATDELAFRLVYDAAAGASSPLVTLVINNVGIDIYKSDIDGVLSSIDGIVEKINEAFGLNIGNKKLATAKAGGANKDELVALVLEILSRGEWVNALNKISLTATEGGLHALVGEAFELNFTCAESGLGLSYLYSKDGGFETGLSVNVSPCGGETVAAGIYKELAKKDDNGVNIYNIVSSKQGSNPFLKLVYDYLFDAIGSISVENILGEGTYEIVFGLNGDNSAIPALAGVTVNAGMYFVGAHGDESKLTEVDLQVLVGEVNVDINVVLRHTTAHTYFYITLEKVMGVTLGGVKVYATEEDIYSTLETLVNAITDTDILGFIGGFIPKTAATAEETVSANGGSASGVNLTDVLYGLLSLDFGEYIYSAETDEENVTKAVINVDGILSALGVNTGYSIGVFEAGINHNTHSMTTAGYATVEEGGKNVSKKWISLSSNLSAVRRYESFDTTEFINVGFIPTMLSDVVKTLTDDNGIVHKSFTFSGTVKADIVSLIKVQIDISTLTLGLRDNGGMYFSLVGNLKVAGSDKGVIGLTYDNGLITLGRNLGGKPEYKVMTFGYFLDNMFKKGDASTLNWLLQTGIWDLAAGQLEKNINIDAGSFNTKDVYLYNATAKTEEKEVSLSEYIVGLAVVLNGERVTEYKSVTDLEKQLGLTDNYYGVDLDAETLTGGVLTKLYAAITRDDTNGVNGLKAYGAIQSFVSFSADLGYKEGADTPYIPGSALVASDKTTAPSLFELALAQAETDKSSGSATPVTADDKRFTEFTSNKENFEDIVFGCLNVYSDKTYEFVNVARLYSHILSVVDFDGKTVSEISVRHGSTVYLYDNANPVYSENDGTMRVLYADKDGNILPASFVLNADGVTVYKAAVKAAELALYNNGEYSHTYHSFVGDEMPTSVHGYSMISDGFYKDAALTQKATGKVGGSCNLYGKFVESEKTVNCVIYRFDEATSSYIVAGKASGFEKEYCTGGKTLFLENKIGAYNVTAIAANALAGTSGEADKCLKNVVVPANITMVGEKAFGDNYSINSIVFLADRVHFLGSKSGKNLPLYGCSTEPDGTKTTVKIYYSEIYCDGGGEWSYFRNKNSYDFYIGGSSIIYGDYGGTKINSNWRYTEIKTDGVAVAEDNDFAIFVSGVTQTGLVEGASATPAETISAITSAVEKRLEGYENEYGKKYIVNVSAAKDERGVEVITVSISLNMPAEIKIYSEIPFTYSYLNQSFAGGNGAMKVTKSGKNIALYAPVPADAKYKFLGWATKEGGKLIFVPVNTAYSETTVYYAVWGVSNIGAEFGVIQTTSGSVLGAPTGSVDGKWYTDNTFSTAVTELTVDKTVVCVRSVLKLSYKVNGSGAQISDSTKGTSQWKSLEGTYEVLEGQKVKGVRSNKNKTLTLYVDGVKLTDLKTSIWNFKSDIAEFTVNGDNTLSISY